MSRYGPLTSNQPDSPVLWIDNEAPLPDVFACADRRIRMARNLLDSLQTAEDCDLRYLATAAHLLLEEGCDALTVVERHVLAAQAAQTTVAP